MPCINFHMWYRSSMFRPSITITSCRQVETHRKNCSGEWNANTAVLQDVNNDPVELVKTTCIIIGRKSITARNLREEAERSIRTNAKVDFKRISWWQTDTRIAPSSLMKSELLQLRFPLQLLGFHRLPSKSVDYGETIQQWSQMIS